jgi:MFS family permease
VNAGLRAVVAASTVTTVGILPVFLVGAVAVLMRAELGFNETQLGLAVSLFFATAALCSVPGGRAVERLGGRRSLVLATAISGVALAGAGLAWSWGALAGCLIVGGLANTLAQMAANLHLAGRVVLERQGLAFGIKQSAVPAATLLGGAAVPVIALPFGWRWVFASAAATALLVGGAQAYRIRGSPPRAARADQPRAAMAVRPLMVMAAAAAFGSAAATAIATFLIGYAVEIGIEPGPGGLVLAIGSAAAVASRVAMGWLADRRDGNNFLVVACMLMAGAAAVAAFPLASTWSQLAVVMVLAYALGWGWPGLFTFTVVRRHPRAPAAATGFTLTGIYIGGVGGPLAFGLLLGSFGYSTAWCAAAASLLAAGSLMLVGGNLAGTP